MFEMDFKVSNVKLNKITTYSATPKTTTTSFNNFVDDKIEEIDYSKYEETTEDALSVLGSSRWGAKKEKTNDYGTTRFWSSWWGDEAQSTIKFFSDVVDSVKSKSDNTWNSLATKEKLDSKRLKDASKALSHQTKNTIAGDKDYKMGSKWKYGPINIFDKRVSKSGYAFDNLKAGVEGENWDASAGLLYGKATGRVQIGVDHVRISGELEGSLAHAEAGIGDTLELGGYNIVSGSASVKADVGHAYLKGDIGAGYYKSPDPPDGDGKMHLDAGIKAEVGADLCSATAKGSATVLGLGVAGEVKAKIGVGLILNAGFQDGKFNLNIGAALGVGIELGVSLDIGGAIDNAKQFTKDVYNSDFAKGFREQVGSFKNWLGFD